MKSILVLACVLGFCLSGLAIVVVPPRVLGVDEQPLLQPVLCEEPPCPPSALDEVKEFLHRGYQKTAESLEGAKGFVSDRTKAAKGSADDAYNHVKDGVHDAADTTKATVQETVEKVKDGVGSTADKAVSFMDAKDDSKSRHEELDPALYIMPRVSKSIDSLQKTFEEERSQIFSVIKDSPSMDALKRRTEGVFSVLHIGDSVEGLKKGVKDTVKGAQEKASNALECASGMACDARDKAGNLIYGIKEKLIPRGHAKGDDADIGMKVHELCSVYGANRGTQKLGAARVEDTLVLHESYAYLMEIAMKAIDDAKDIFEKTAIERGAVEWKEKYSYLVNSAKGALEGANHVFERAVTTIEGDIQQRQQEEHARAKDARHLTTRLRAMAARTKQHLSSTWHSLLCTSYLASFAMAFGVALWTTFFSGQVLSQGLPRQQLALVQSKLFPVYLSVITGCLLVCTLGHAILHPWLSANLGERLQIWNFSFSLIVSLCSMFILEPRVTKVMFEKLRIEREEGRGQSGDSIDGAAPKHPISVDAKFQTLHQTASFANLLIIAGLTWHLWYLAQRLIAC